MATLEKLLADDGFKRGRIKPKMRRSETACSSAAISESPQLSSSCCEVLLAKTRVDSNPRRYFSLVPEKDKFKESSPSSTSVMVCSSSMKSKEFDGCSGKNLRRLSSFDDPDCNSALFMVAKSKDGSIDKSPSNLKYNKFFENDLYEIEKPKDIQRKPSLKEFKDGRPLPGLDTDALKFITSLINSCVNQILDDKSFRLSLHRACVSSLKLSLHYKENKVIYTLIEAIKAVERIITEGSNPRELKKTSLKLCLITSIKSMESEHEHTCGIPNSHLAACGHLYLSILYKIQKKDKVSTKHLLQVFSDSPNHARKTLLPELWDKLFSRNLSELKAWYSKEAGLIPETSDMEMMREFLDKAYNNVVDTVTSQYADYYKVLLMEGGNSHAVPSISIPFEYFSSNNLDPSKITIDKSMHSDLSEVKRNKTTLYHKQNVKGKGKDENEERKLDAWRGEEDDHMQKDENETHAAESLQECYYTCSQHSDSSVEENDVMKEIYRSLSTSNSFEAEEIQLGNNLAQYSHEIKEHIHVRKCDLHENEHELELKKLAKLAFQLQVTGHPDYANTHASNLSIDSSVHCLERDEIKDIKDGKLAMGDTESTSRQFDPTSLQEKTCDALSEHFEVYYKGDSLFSGIPKEFICPLTHKLLKEPVTLESGHTFELAAIKSRLDQGHRTCPLTGQSNHLPIPDSNSVLKRMINVWVAECFSNCPPLVSQNPLSPTKEAYSHKRALPFFIIEQWLTGFNLKETEENVEHLISLGGLQFLTEMLELGSFEVKLRAAKLLVWCVQAGGCYRNQLVKKISKSSILCLVYSKRVYSRSRAISLLIELICLNRRTDITTFVNGLKTEDIGNIKNELLLCIKSSPPEERVFVAVLLLHFDSMEEVNSHSVYKEDAVKCFVEVLECCLFNKLLITNCRRSLLMLGGHFSSSGEPTTELWLLKMAGYDCRTLRDEDDITISEEEFRVKEDWLKSMALILLQYGKKSFFEALFQCWKIGSPDIMRACAVTTAWLSHALTSLHIPFQTSVFSILMPRLIECLKSNLDIELKVLASLSLFNFSKIMECRVSLLTFADEIHDPLLSLIEVTWTAKHLYKDIYTETP